MRRIVFAFLALLFFCNAHAELRHGELPPDGLGVSQDGQAMSLAPLHGKVVVISFWATWCGYCMKEMPVLAGLQAVAAQRNLPLQVVSIDYREDRDVFKRSARAIHARLPSLLLGWDRDGKIGQVYGTNRGIPVMVMLHRDGTVAHIHVGYGEKMLDRLVAEINALLLEPAPSVARSN